MATTAPALAVIELVPDLKPYILAARGLRDERNSLAQFLPPVAKQAVSYRLGRKKRLDQTVPIRAIDSPAIPIRRPGVVEVRGDLPAVTPIVPFSELDLTQEMILAQQLNGLQVDWSPWVTQGAALCAATTDNTYELMRGQVLSATKISLETEDGAVHEVDFEVPSANKIEINDAWDPFNDPEAVFADLKAAHEQFIDSSGDAAGLMLTTINVYNAMVSALQALFPQQPLGDTNLAAYLAQNRMPSVVRTYDRKFDNGDGTKTRVYPEGFLTFLPSTDSPVGQTEMGVTQEAVQQVQGQILTAAEAPGMTIQTLGSDNPVTRAVKAASIGMPVLRDNDSIVVLSGLLG